MSYMSVSLGSKPRFAFRALFLTVIVPWLASINEDGGSMFASGCTFSKSLVVFSGSQTDQGVKEMNDGLWPGLTKSGQRELLLAFGDIKVIYMESDAGGVFEAEEHQAYVRQWLAKNMEVKSRKVYCISHTLDSYATRNKIESLNTNAPSLLAIGDSAYFRSRG
jgi:hypothetical protein